MKKTADLIDGMMASGLEKAMKTSAIGNEINALARDHIMPALERAIPPGTNSLTTVAALARVLHSFLMQLPRQKHAGLIQAMRDQMEEARS